MMMDDLERSLLAAGRVEPDADLRARVLAAATPLVDSDRSRLDRIWFSPRWRMAAAVVVLVLVALNAVWTNTVATATAQHLGPVDNAQAVAMAAREAGFTPDETVAFCAQAIAAARATRMAAFGADTFTQRSSQ